MPQRGKMIQLTHVQIDGYGPWTLRQGSDREPCLQILQTSLYADIQRLFSEREALAFPTRFDNLIAVTNGVDGEAHSLIQRTLSQKYPLTVSMGVGCGKTPYEAQRQASENLRRRLEGVARRRMILAASNPHCFIEGEKSLVQIAHMDVENATALVTDKVSAYEAYQLMNEIEAHIDGLLSRYGSLVFFSGGDNFIALSNGVTVAGYLRVVNSVYRKFGLQLKIGVGLGATAKAALKMANRGLDGIRRRNYEGPIHVNGL